MDNCVFCNIANHTQSADILFENENVVVFSDIMPQAPVHMQIIPKEHIPSVNELSPDKQNLISEMILVAKQQAYERNIAQDGYKLVFNVGKHGGQVIPHLHLHLLGGKQLPE